MHKLLALALLVGLTGQSTPRLNTAGSPVPPSAAPGVEQAAVEARRLDLIEPLVREAIEEKKLPGAVVLIGRGDRVIYQKAFGNRSLVPSVEAMTLDTVFDLASLTKVVATTTSVMMLVEQGRIRLSDRVASYIPGFERYGKADITVRHLLTHVSGLRPDVDLADTWQGSETAIALAIEEVPASAPGERFVYSDINFFLLGDIVRRVSGLPLDQFARQRIFEPLGMKDTTFTPPPSMLPRIAPTENCSLLGWPCQGPDMRPARDMQMLRGIVHDPTARRMGGVAGHAGLFSTAADLAIFSRMLLGGGVYQGHSHPCSADRSEDDHRRDTGCRAQREGHGMGHRFVLFRESRGVAPGRLVRSHRFHRHVAVDRSGNRPLRDFLVEPGSSRRQG